MTNFTSDFAKCLLDSLGPQFETSIKEYIRSSLEEAFNELMKMELGGADIFHDRWMTKRRIKSVVYKNRKKKKHLHSTTSLVR